jgi:hypothetical protein
MAKDCATIISTGMYLFQNIIEFLEIHIPQQTRDERALILLFDEVDHRDFHASSTLFPFQHRTLPITCEISCQIALEKGQIKIN